MGRQQPTSPYTHPLRLIWSEKFAAAMESLRKPSTKWYCHGAVLTTDSSSAWERDSRKNANKLLAKRMSIESRALSWTPRGQIF